MDQLHQIFNGEVHKTSQRKQTLTIIGICWQSNLREQGRNALNRPQVGFERAARGEVRDTDTARAEMLARMGALEQLAEQSWTPHHFTPLDEMNSVAGDETQRRNLPSEASSELQRHQRQNQEHLQEYQEGVQRHLSEVQNEAQSQQDASREEVEN